MYYILFVRFCINIYNFATHPLPYPRALTGKPFLKKCTLVQFFFGNICKCRFFFVTLWRQIVRV